MQAPPHLPGAAMPAVTVAAAAAAAAATAATAAAAFPSGALPGVPLSVPSLGHQLQPQVAQAAGMQQLHQMQQMQHMQRMMQAAQYAMQVPQTVAAQADPRAQLSLDATHCAVQNLTAEEAASMGSVMASAATTEKKKVHLRKAAGHIWSDPTLDEWSENDHRVFCGDLGNEVTDEVLASAFRKYKSFDKARVVRDKRTGKTKGYGFVSFMDPNDMLKAIKEMNYKYVGNRPIRVLRSKWKDREIDSQRNKQIASIVKKVEKNDSKTLRKFKKLGVNINGGKAARNHEILASQAPKIRKNYVPPVAYGRMTYQYIKGAAPALPAPAPGTGASSHLLDDI
ncbi:RNA recognition motif-containing protein, putative [Eimeria maxima]|uniref:RNA recognition motif-containing protein, putative n=1 Tax=Eimeria maxima TaxID=5804 RepID=U6LZ76_EIMMA|nr:RNA recognition motif-containing protein, putative [Eimeria maxima]CDJ57272.1 RNA recognition motif-containing protein, putative [Eimeria maxima]